MNVYTIKAGEVQGGRVSALWSLKEINYEDFEMPDVDGKTLDMLTRYTVKKERVPEIEGYTEISPQS